MARCEEWENRGHADKIERLIYWIEDRTPPQLAIVARPRGNDWLEDDLAELRAGGIDILISFLAEDEAEELGLREEGPIATRLGMEFISYPIPDRTVPGDLEGFRELIAWLAKAVRAGKCIGAHCRACIGRSTVLIASLMIALGADPEVALYQIEEARGWMVPDTPEQRHWILNFQPEP
jgi:protein-tyrosine phosphatase